jgi:hypothetical protein
MDEVSGAAGTAVASIKIWRADEIAWRIYFSEMQMMKDSTLCANESVETRVSSV